MRLTEAERWAARHKGKRRCDVIRPGAGDCAGVSVSWFTAVCAHGHVMEGTACRNCKTSPKLGCGTCYAGTRRRVPVTISYEELAATA